MKIFNSSDHAGFSLKDQIYKKLKKRNYRITNLGPFNDFQKQKIKFDINKLKEAYSQVLKIKDFQGVEGVTNFGAISLTQIPGAPDSVKGNKARGIFWTKPDQSGKEVVRDQMIDESAYSEFISDYKETYFKEVVETLQKNYNIGRVRILLKTPRST